MTEFPYAELLGGGLIGLAAVVLLLLNGKVAGISGIAAGLLPSSARVPDRAWRFAFVAGLVLAPLILVMAGHSSEITFVAPISTTIVAGLLVGFGTVLGNGCTSGHGVCGVARLSPRSLVATAVFMTAGIATAFVARHVVGG